MEKVIDELRGNGGGNSGRNGNGGNSSRNNNKE